MVGVCQIRRRNRAKRFRIDDTRIVERIVLGSWKWQWWINWVGDFDVYFVFMFCVNYVFCDIVVEWFLKVMVVSICFSGCYNNVFFKKKNCLIVFSFVSTTLVNAVIAILFSFLLLFQRFYGKDTSNRRRQRAVDKDVVVIEPLVSEIEID